jgi:DNA-damage-inducible protein J
MATTIQVRVDNDIKAAAEELFTSIGLDISTAVRMFLSASIRAQGLPFEARRQFNAETIEAFEDVMYNRNLTGPFDTVEEMMASLLADDDDAEA